MMVKSYMFTSFVCGLLGCGPVSVSFWLLLSDTPILDLTTPAYMSVTSSLVLACFGITWFLKDFGVIVDLTGGVSGSMIYFIVPAIMSITVSLKAKTRPWLQLIIASLLLVFGVGAMVLSVVYTLV